MSIINALWNAYAISFTFSMCTGNEQILNGLTASGLGTYDNAANPHQVLVGMKLAYQGQTLVIVGGVTKM